MSSPRPSSPQPSSPQPAAAVDQVPEPLDPEDGGFLVGALVDRLPEFVPVYLALVEACDDDPGEPVVLAELADFVAERMAVLETDRHLLEGALAVIEAHLASGDAAGSGASDELVALAFFDSFSPEDRRHLIPWLGRRSLAALESLDAPDPG